MEDETIACLRQQLEDTVEELGQMKIRAVRAEAEVRALKRKTKHADLAPAAACGTESPSVARHLSWRSEFGGTEPSTPFHARTGSRGASAECADAFMQTDRSPEEEARQTSTGSAEEASAAPLGELRP